MWPPWHLYNVGMYIVRSAGSERWWVHTQLATGFQEPYVTPLTSVQCLHVHCEEYWLRTLVSTHRISHSFLYTWLYYQIWWKCVTFLPVLQYISYWNVVHYISWLCCLHLRSNWNRMLSFNHCRINSFPFWSSLWVASVFVIITLDSGTLPKTIPGHYMIQYWLLMNHKCKEQITWISINSKTFS